jgi:hypothetical protein
VAACYARPVERLARPRPGGMVQRRNGSRRGHCVRRRGGVLTGSSVVAGRWQSVAGELAGATGRASGKAVGGGAHPSGGAAAPVTDDVDGVALQCQGRR